MRLRSALASVFHSCRVKTTSGITGMPWAAAIRFVIDLSMATAEANMSHPTNGTPAMPKSPIRLPSSPSVPCMAGNATSIRTLRPHSPGHSSHNPPSNSNRSFFCFARNASMSARLKKSKSLNVLCEYHEPSRAIYTGKTSNCRLARSDPITGMCAVIMETSCSTLCPPNITAIVFLLCILVWPVVLQHHHIPFYGKMGQRSIRRRRIVKPRHLACVPRIRKALRNIRGCRIFYQHDMFYARTRKTRPDLPMHRFCFFSHLHQTRGYIKSSPAFERGQKFYNHAHAVGVPVVTIIENSYAACIGFRLKAVTERPDVCNTLPDLFMRHTQIRGNIGGSRKRTYV